MKKIGAKPEARKRYANGGVANWAQYIALRDAAEKAAKAKPEAWEQEMLLADLGEFRKKTPVVYA